MTKTKTFGDETYTYDYDERGNLIHHHDGEGHDFWRQFDENNNMIYFRDYEGYEEVIFYNLFHQIVEYRNNLGRVWIRVEDGKNRVSNSQKNVKNFKKIKKDYIKKYINE